MSALVKSPVGRVIRGHQAITPLRTAFISMRAQQPAPNREPAYNIALYASHDLKTFSASVNQVGSGDHSTPEAALAAGVAAHARMNPKPRQFPVNLKGALTNRATRKAQAQ